jgi:hypothetical protein
MGIVVPVFITAFIWAVCISRLLALLCVCVSHGSENFDDNLLRCGAV